MKVTLHQLPHEPLHTQQYDDRQNRRPFLLYLIEVVSREQLDIAPPITSKEEKGYLSHDAFSFTNNSAREPFIYMTFPLLSPRYCTTKYDGYTEIVRISYDAFFTRLPFYKL